MVLNCGMAFYDIDMYYVWVHLIKYQVNCGPTMGYLNCILISLEKLTTRFRPLSVDCDQVSYQKRFMSSDNVLI